MPNYQISPRMFKSNFLDFFSRSPWWLVPIIWLPISYLLLRKGITGSAHLGFLNQTIIFISGIITWSLSEYWLHRLLFHWVPNFKSGKQFHFIIHGVHHDWPNDHYRLVMPLLASSILAVLLGTSFYLLLGAKLFYLFFGAYLIGYVQYEMTHYAVHHLKFKNKIFKFIKRHHLLHHHNSDYSEKKFGVSSPIWDYVFRTF